MFYTYVLVCESLGKTYIGQTNNLEDRLKRHNSNRNLFTKNKGKWKLIFSKAFNNRGEAILLEKKLKGFKNKNYLLNWISDNS